MVNRAVMTFAPTGVPGHHRHAARRDCPARPTAGRVRRISGRASSALTLAMPMSRRPKRLMGLERWRRQSVKLRSMKQEPKAETIAYVMFRRTVHARAER